MSTTSAAAQRTADTGAARPRPALIAATLGSSMIIFDAVVVTVALPAVRADLGGGIPDLQWVVDGYTLMFAGLLLSAGSLSDRLGAGRAFGAGVVGFVLASAACGLAPSMPVLIGGRFAQGVAAAAMMPSSMALIGQAYPDPARRARAVAVWAMGGAVASSTGPVVGGLLTLVSWRWIFLVNLPIGAVALVLLARTAASPRRPAPFDAVGQITAVLAMGGLTYGAIEAGATGPTAPRVVTAFAVSAVALIAFAVAQARGAHPMVPLDLLRSRTVGIAAVVGFAFVVGQYGLPFVMSLYLQQLRGLSAVQAGLSFLPMMSIGLLLTPVSARIGDRVGRRPLIAAGMAAMALGLLLLGLAPGATPVWALTALMALVGLAGPLVMPAMTTVLLGGVPEQRVGVASGVFNTSRQVGGALAIAVFGALLAGPDFLHGLRTSLLIGAAVALTAAAVSLRLRAPRTTSPSPDERTST